ncbi:MAG: hypothetical protein J0H68_03455 [Sphingobacteriia bacterium]|nr:hypothetical protein [Sphingobacteriia bacterium]
MALVKKKSILAYTIAELAVSITILGVLTSIGLATLGKDNLEERYSKTLRKTKVIEQAIFDYYNQRGFIPCPAIGNLIETNASFGISETYNTTSLECEGGLTDNTGAVPVRTLQIDDDYAYDGWGRKFTYRVSRGMSSVVDFSNTDNKGDIVVVDVNGAEITNTGNSPPNNFGAVYVIVSHGANGDQYAWRRNNTTTPVAPTTTVEYENSDHGLNKIYMQNIRTSSFDDILAFKTKVAFLNNKKGRAPLIFSKLTCSNAKYFSSNTVSTTAFVTSTLSDQIKSTAIAIGKMCDNPPNICSFRPTDVSDLVVWYDGTDPAATGTAPAAGSRVATLVNKAGSSYNATQGTVANQPTYTTTTQIPTTKRGLDFSSTSQQLLVDLRSAIYSGGVGRDYTIFFMGKMGYDRNIINISSSCTGTFAATQHTSLRYKYGTNNFGGVGTSMYNMLIFSSWNYDLELYVDQNDIEDIPIITAGRYCYTCTTPAPNNMLGTSLYFYSKKGLYLTGRRVSHRGANTMACSSNAAGMYISPSFLGEMLIYNRALTDKEISQVNEYLSNRWFNNVCN